MLRGLCGGWSVANRRGVHRLEKRRLTLVPRRVPALRGGPRCRWRISLHFGKFHIDHIVGALRLLLLRFRTLLRSLRLRASPEAISHASPNFVARGRDQQKDCQNVREKSWNHEK